MKVTNLNFSMVQLSYVLDKGDLWEIVIFMSGPKPVENDEDRSTSFRGRYIRYCYIFKKKDCPNKGDMRLHGEHILEFYQILRDEHPTKFHDLYSYAYNHPPGDYLNATWLFNNQYWGPGVPGHVDRLEVSTKTIVITMNIDYEDLLNMDWIMREDSSDELDFSSDEDPLNVSIPSYHSSSDEQ